MKMYPDRYLDFTRTTCKYPLDRLLPLQGVVKDDELRHPTVFSTKGERCFPVTKSRTSTGVTIGRASGMMSFVREYFPSGNYETSMELAFYRHCPEDGAFSAHGDSGSIIADGTGRIVSLLTGGCGKTDKTDFDVSYATFLLPLGRAYQAAIPRRLPLPAHGLGVPTSVWKTSARLARR